MTPIETYLQSEEAITEVAHLLAKGGPIALSLSPEAGGKSRVSHDLQAWRRVALRPGWGQEGEVEVYFRAEPCPKCASAPPQVACQPDRYVVSDLGEAVRALRLRTAVEGQG